MVGGASQPRTETDDARGSVSFDRRSGERRRATTNTPPRSRGHDAQLPRPRPATATTRRRRVGRARPAARASSGPAVAAAARRASTTMALRARFLPVSGAAIGREEEEVSDEATSVGASIEGTPRSPLGLDFERDATVRAPMRIRPRSPAQVRAEIADEETEPHPAHATAERVRARDAGCVRRRQPMNGSGSAVRASSPPRPAPRGRSTASSRRGARAAPVRTIETSGPCDSGRCVGRRGRAARGGRRSPAARCRRP